MLPQCELALHLGQGAIIAREMNFMIAGSSASTVWKGGGDNVHTKIGHLLVLELKPHSHKTRKQICMQTL